MDTFFFFEGLLRISLPKGATEPLNLALVVTGVALGLFIGAMPGLGSVNGVAILLPMTFLVLRTGAVIFLAAICYGAMYGGAISSIMLGLRGSPTTAILLGGMVIWGLEPEPRLFLHQKEFVWGLTASLNVANFFALLLKVLLIPLFVWVLRMPFTILAPMIFILCVVGGYAPTQSLHDVWLMFFFGVAA